MYVMRISDFSETFDLLLETVRTSHEKQDHLV